MANKIYYLEPDEEITKVINRIRQSEEEGVVLVVPRNSTLTQSVINLKLLKRGAEEHDKMIGLVTTDRVTKNLADQLGVKVFARASEAEKAMLMTEAAKPPIKSDEGDLKVHTYKKYDLSALNKDELPVEDSEDEEVQLSKKTLVEVEDHSVFREDDGTGKEELGSDGGEEESQVAEDRREDEKTKKEDDDMRLGSGRNRPFGNARSRYIKTGGSRKPLAILAAVTVIVLVIVVLLFLPSAKASLVLKTTNLDKIAEKIPDDKEEITDKIYKDEKLHLINKKLNLLGEKYKTIIILRYQQDMSVKEISEILNIEYSSTKVSLFRAIHRLQELCEDEN